MGRSPPVKGKIESSSIKIEKNEKLSNDHAQVSDQQPKKEVKTHPMNNRLMMRRAITIPHQTIQANNLLRLKTPNSRKKIKSKKNSSLVQQRNIQATAIPLLVATVNLVQVIEP